MKISRVPAWIGLCAAVVGATLLAPDRASAVPLVVVTESAQGQFTLLNNSNSWFVYGFEIQRPGSSSNPTTTQPGWSAYTCIFTCNVSATTGFGYVLDGLASPFVSGIAPHTSSSNFFFADPGPNIVDGSSNTIVFGEALDIIVYAAAMVTSIQDGSSNTILFGENNQPSFPVWFQFRGSVLPGVADGTSNTIFIGETQLTPVPAALPLFGTGLGALGLLGWRKRRKSGARAA